MIDLCASGSRFARRRESARERYRTVAEWRRAEQENLLAALEASGGKVAGIARWRSLKGPAMPAADEPHTWLRRLSAGTSRVSAEDLLRRGDLSAYGIASPDNAVTLVQKGPAFILSADPRYLACARDWRACCIVARQVHPESGTSNRLRGRISLTLSAGTNRRHWATVVPGENRTP